LILGQGLTRAFFRVEIGIKMALQIMLVGVDIFCSAFFRRLHLRSNRRLHLRIRGNACELTVQLSHDGLGEFGLDGEYVFQITRKISDQSCSPVSVRVSRAAIRTTSPALRTLPSTRCATPSFCPISC